ncbi:MAG: type I-E CRISPR-associated protein Cse1/CasA [Deltaproteobacteria bacterium]|nr:type I-E CRISPR-associated protein Cse1/CasA [Deltaproteobacteria bacterium]
MADPLFDILTEDVFTVEDLAGTRAKLSLPGVLARLGAGTDTEFCALQAHQQHPWFAFLVQVAALALHRAGETSPAQSEARWRELLLALTNGAREPWCLVVPDLSKPAFFQPPVPEGKLDDFQDPNPCPDTRDVVIMTRNHDQKAARVHHPRPEHWAYSLVSVQTMDGYRGVGNHGVARMKGGYGSRPGVSFAPDARWAGRFLRDVAMLLESRPALLEKYGYADHGHALLWRLPWDGKPESALGLRDCDPFFIETCRRFRLVFQQGSLASRFRPTATGRLKGIEGGATGDPWAPVDADAGVLTIGERGFDYRKTQELLAAQDWEAPGLELRPEDGKEPVFLARVLARGQGKTAGLHERAVRIPPRMRATFGARAQRDRLGILSRARVERAGEVQKKALYPALKTLLNAGDTGSNRDLKDKPSRWTERYDRSVDACFFDQLWDAWEAPSPQEAEASWLKALIAIARGVLAQAQDEVALPTQHRMRAFAASERVFEGSARKNFPEAFPPKGESNG